MDDADHLILDIMELRAYARTKEQLDHATRPEEAPTGPMLEWVFRVQAELLRQQREG